MITSRQSGARRKNAKVELTADAPGNSAWIAARGDAIARPGAVLLLGGTNVVDFRLRIAQSHLRHDLLPSFWSQVGILVSAETFLTVPLDERLAPPRVPSFNAIHECPLAAYDDPRRYPNIALINFADPSEAIVEHARRLETQRSAIDLPQLVVAWLGFAWGAGATGNPLVQNLGIPGAALVETAFGMAGIELTPGVASAASCPEAIWQSALWWHEYYEKTAEAGVEGAAGRKKAAEDREPATIVPFGAYLTRQPAAAAIEDVDYRPASAERSGGAPRRTPASRRRGRSRRTR